MGIEKVGKIVKQPSVIDNLSSVTSLAVGALSLYNLVKGVSSGVSTPHQRKLLFLENMKWQKEYAEEIEQEKHERKSYDHLGFSINRTKIEDL
jgi:hypothetical protein